MKIDITEFPIVKINYEQAPELSIDMTLSELSELLKRAQPFVFLGDNVPEKDNENVEDRKKVAVWMKANRTDVEKWIKGHVQITFDDEQFQAMEEFSIIFKKFWGYPMVVVRSQADALSAAQRLLMS